MNTSLKFALISGVITTMLTGCATKPFEEELVYKPLHSERRQVIPESTDLYIREVTPEEEILSRRVSLVGNVALIDALRSKLPNLTLKPMDKGVDLAKEVNIYANRVLVKDYLASLGALTGYDIVINKDAVEIRSFLRREWNMAAFASKRMAAYSVGSSLAGTLDDEEGSGSDSNEIKNSSAVTLVSMEDDWQTIMNGARSILGASSDSNDASQSSQASGGTNIVFSGSTPTLDTGNSSSDSDKEDPNLIKPYVSGVRSLGLIAAGGEPNRVEILDSYFSNLREMGEQQVNISVQAYNVTLNDSRGTGIDWGNLSNIGGTLNGNDLGFGFSSSPNSSVLKDSLFETGISFEGSQGKGNAILNFLSSYGEVELLNQPNLTVRNGAYSYIHTGEEIGYVAEVKTTITQTASSTGVEIERLKLGVTLAVTARVLDDERILLDIWPVVSSLDDQSEDKIFQLSSEGEDISLESPEVLLQELSTQVIAQNGVPIQMGGFIRRSIAKKLQDLPWRNRLTGKLLSPIFSSKVNELKREELVLLVTPTIVAGV